MSAFDDGQPDEKQPEGPSVLAQVLWAMGALVAVVATITLTIGVPLPAREPEGRGDLARQSQPAAQDSTVASAADIARLIDAINDDRAAMTKRIEALEHTLDSITGSIPQQEPAKTGLDGPTEPIAMPAAKASPERPAEDPMASTVAAKASFGSEIAQADSLRALSAQWSYVRNRHAQLDRQKPVFGTRETDKGQVFRLIIGPFSNAAGAASLCATLSQTVPSCSTVAYVGSPLPDYVP